MKRKPLEKRAQAKPLTAEGKKRRAARLRDWRVKLDQLRLVEAERH